MSFAAGRWAPAILGVALIVSVIAILAGALVAAPVPSAVAAPAYTARASGGLSAQPVLGFPATGATVIGASPADSQNAGEVWAEGAVGSVPATVANGSTVSDSEVLVRRTEALGNWQIVPVADAQGNALATGWTAATVTPAGAVVLAGIEATPGAPADPAQILIRQPGSSAFAPATPVPGEDLEPGETLSSAAAKGTPILAADDEAGGTGIFVAPLEESTANPGLLHYESGPGTWRREPICAIDTSGTCTAPSERLTIDAISVSSPENAWMVATPAGGGAAATPQLYERVPASGGASGDVWLEQTVTSPLLASGSGLALPAAPAEGAGNSGAILTASGDGAWLDLTHTGGPSSGTLFYAGGKVLGSWCSEGLSCPGDTGALPADLPAGYGSIATEAASGSSPGARVITGLPRGAMMVLEPGATSFAYRITTGGESEANGAVSPDLAGGNTFGPGGVTVSPALREGKPALGGGAAFSSPTEAWIGIGGPTPGPQVAHLSQHPFPSALQAWPLPAPLPLLAIAGAPGTEAAGGSGEAFAVGARGEILRFHPGEGWTNESLTSPGASFAEKPLQAPTLRAVAWPTANEAFAVGDHGTMLRWQAGTETWEPDPGKPAGFEADLTGVAFSSADPSVGYAVGKDGTLLTRFAAGSWGPEAPPPGLAEADFSSIAFAGGEAIAAYRLPGSETGGLIVNEGSGWRIEASVAGLLAGAKITDPVLTTVAGLPDGGAVAAGPGIVLERESSSAPWRFSPTPLGELSDGAVSALAAYRDPGGKIRALVSVDPDPTEAPNVAGSAWQRADGASPPEPDPLPNQGFVVRQTEGGWVDTELEDFPGIAEPSPGLAVDRPGWPDGVYAMLVTPSGESGWMVGGQTGGTAAPALAASPSAEEVATFAASQAGSASRFYPGPSPPVGTDSPFTSLFNLGSSSITTPLFAFGGGSGCNGPCADDAQQLLGPNADLSQAISEAGRIPGLRGFFYTGRQIGWTAGAAEAPGAYARELGQLSDVLSGGAPEFPTYAVPNGPAGQGGGGDIQSPGDEAIYQGELGVHDPVSSSVGPAPPAGTTAYAFESEGSGGKVRMIVLDFSQGNSAADQEAWLAAELAEARSAGVPTLVTGADDITESGAGTVAADAGAIRAALLAGGASGYIFDSGTSASTIEVFGPSESPVPVVGVGTLGAGPQGISGAGSGAELTSTPGFLLIGVYTQAIPGGFKGPDPLTIEGEIPVVTQVAPNAVGLSLPSGEARDFSGFARSPQGGSEIGTRPQYLAFPGPSCSFGCESLPQSAFPPDITFKSSNPAVGQFVFPANGNSTTTPEIDPKTHQLIPDPFHGFFCALSPGQTTVTLAAGGVAYSETVTVTASEIETTTSNTVAKPLEAPVCPVAAAASQTAQQAESPANGSQSPVPAPIPHPHPGVHHHQHPAPGHSPVHESRPSPYTHPSVVAPVPTGPVTPQTPQPAPAKPPLPAGAAPPQPAPPSGVSPAPSPGAANVPANAPAPTPGGVPLNVTAAERRSSPAVGLEHAQHHFAAYRPPGGGPATTSIALLALALVGGGAGAATLASAPRRRNRLDPTRRGDVALAQTHAPARHRRHRHR